MKVLTNPDNKKIAKIWVDELWKVESVTLDQIRLMLELPGLFRHIAVMPDTHLGKGAVVGGVVATQNVIVPNIVGVDIGCGMSAFRMPVKLDQKMKQAFWQRWKQSVEHTVPTGFGQHAKAQDLSILDKELTAKALKQNIAMKGYFQIGTLGGGNHFLEAQTDEEGYIWFMVHSGSRNMGLQIALYHNKIAKEFNQKYYSRVPDDLWFLRLDDPTGQAYLNDMQWATDYALESRWRMLEAMVEAFAKLTGTDTYPLKVRSNGINIHHNFANLEHHFGENVVIHRKGATQAREGQLGIIPGSMGTTSYIVEGLGNKESYMSCSHGAGRLMSRNAAKKTFTQSDLEKALEHTYTKPFESFLDEAPQAYKDVDEVIANQQDLVKVVHTLKPLITIKGGGGRDD